MKRPSVIAHRGGRRWAPENTLAAFSKAIALNCDGIELDIHRCASGELVVIHDEELSRTTNGVGLIKDATLPELKRLSAGLWYGEEFKEERIPTLEEVLTLVDGALVINIEVKNAPSDYEGIEDDLFMLLESYPYQDRLIISSFDHHFMRRFNEMDSGLKLALLAEAIFVDLKEYAHKIGAACWHPCFQSLTEAAIHDGKHAGLEINAWTLNSAREWSSAIKAGIDGIITDDPEGLKAVLARVESFSEPIS